jgi:hypothetical protein
MALFSDKEEVTFYPTRLPAGRQLGDPMRVWVHEKRSLIEQQLEHRQHCCWHFGVHGPIELTISGPTQDFVADSESREVVTFSFDEDSEERH